jgi:PAS domain S-box-containing protein
MVQINAPAKEILLKIVYYGPALSGKTANLQTLHAMCHKDFQGEFFSINTQEDRTLFFDLLPIELGDVYDHSIHLKVYTVPGQPQYDATRRVVLESVDGLVFVADSSESKLQENIDSFTNMQHNLSANGLDIKHIPLAIQYNKRDLPNAMPVGVMNRKLNFRSAPYFESVAITGSGVLDTLVSIVLDALAAVFQKYELDQNIKDINALAEKVEAGLRSILGSSPASEAGLIKEKTTVVRQENTSIEDLPQGRLMDPNELLTDAINSSMETAKLYASQKKANEEIEKRHSSLALAKADLEKAHDDNLKARLYLEMLIQSLGEAIVSFGFDGHIFTWNAAAESFFGTPYSEAFGCNIAQFVNPEARSEIAQAAQKLQQGAAGQTLSCTCLHKDGKEFEVSMALFPIAEKDSPPIAVSCVIKRKG